MTPNHYPNGIPEPKHPPVAAAGQPVHLCCTPFITWCHKPAGALLTTKSPRTFNAQATPCPDCQRLYHWWLDNR